MHFLFGVPGQLKILIDRITAAVATEAKQDIIDTNVDTINTNTALIKADTDNYLNASVAAIPTTNLTNIYSGYASITATGASGSGLDLAYWDVTIAAGITDYTKCELDFRAYNVTAATSNGVFARLTGNTTLRVSKPFLGASTDDIKIAYTVYEYN